MSDAGAWENNVNEKAALRAEVERLRAELRAALLSATAVDKESKKLRAYNAELRAALHWTAQNCLDQACVKRAMAAIEAEGK